MTETVFRGPAYSAGSMIDGRIEGASDGPGIEYQGDCFPDPRWFPTRKDGVGPGRVPAFLSSPFAVLVDTIPSTTSTSSIAAAQTVTSGTPMTLTTVAPGGSGAGVPSLAPVQLVPFQKSAGSAVAVLALDFGFATGTVVAGSGTVTVLDSSIYQLGQWICIGGAGNSAKTASLFTQVTAAPTATTITVSPVSAASLSNAPIGSTNLPSAGYSQPNAVPSGVDPYLTAGLARIFNPNEGLARSITLVNSAASGGGVVIVRGYDIYGVPMSENITIPATTTPVVGNKAFKYVASITPQFTSANTYSAGPSNVCGINLRSLFWEYTSLFYAGAFATSNAAWTAAATTSPATATTGDVRGTVNLNQGTAPFNAAANGANRLTIALTVRLIDDIQATPLNVNSLFGVPQFTQ